MIYRINTTAVRKRRIDGEDDAHSLLVLLNDRDDYRAVRAARQRILNLLHRLQQLSSAAVGSEYAIGRLPIVARVSQTGTVDVMFSFGATFGPDRAANAAKVLEGGAVKGLVVLAWKGLLGRLRQCKQCSRWLFATKSDHEFCPAPRRCCQKFHESTQEYRDKRNKRLRANYKLQKEKERKHLAIIEHERERAMERKHAKKR